jgi:hypothetical protein
VQTGDLCPPHAVANVGLSYTHSKALLGNTGVIQTIVPYKLCVCVGRGGGTLQDRGGTNKGNITPLRAGYLKANFIFVVVLADMDD